MKKLTHSVVLSVFLGLLLLIPLVSANLGNLSVCYPFDANASDYFGVWNGNSTADLDTTTYKVGSGCYDFESTNSDKIDVAGWGDLVDLQSNWTICMWANSETTTAGKSPWGQQPGTKYLAGNWDAGGLAFYGGGSDIDLVNSSITPTAGDWNLLCWAWSDNDTAYIYRNTTMVGTKVKSNTDTGYTLDIGVRESATNYYDGRIDEFMVWNRTLTVADITELWNGGAGKTCVEVATGTAPAGADPLKFVSQVPTDITSTSVIGTLLNITYNVTNTTAVDEVLLNYSYTGGGGCYRSVNKSCEVYFNTSYIKRNDSVAGNITSFYLDDNDIYPASYNLNESQLENATHTFNSLTSQNEYILITLNNISVKNYNIFEVMANSTGQSRVYYCNSSYALNNPETSAYCFQFGILNRSDFNHTHEYNKSKHNLFSFPINTTSGLAGGISVTSKSYFLLRGPTSGATYVYSVATLSDNSLFKNTTNSGSAFNNMTGLTIDSHIHQYNGTEIFNYTGCYNKTGTVTCLAFRSDTLEVSPLPPTTPTITNPSADAQNGTEYFNLTWMASAGFNSSTYISGYNVSLLNNDTTLNQTLIGNTTNTSYYFNLYNLNLSATSYRFRVVATDSLESQAQDISRYINLPYNARLNVSARYARDNSSLTNFTFNISDQTSGESRRYTDNNGSVMIDIQRGRNYSITLDSDGYALTYQNYTTTNMTYQNVTIDVYTENSVLVTIYNENTFALITDNITVTFSSGGTENIRWTNNGTLYESGLTDGEWNVKFTGSNYTTKTYVITVENRSFQYLNAYISSSYSTVIFTIQDSSSSALLEGASMTMERLINSSWTIVESKLSDITGRAQFSYLPAVKYKFTVSLTSYTTKIFYLDPIIFSTYSINLDPELDYSSESDYSELQIAFYPKIFYNNRQNNLTFIISSPTGKLTNYTIQVTAPGGSNYTSGNLANGESFLLYFNITNATIFDRVNINYSYDTTDGAIKTYQFRYSILGPGSVANHTISQVISSDYGMGAFEKALLVMIAVILLAGFAYMAIGMTGALLVGLLIEGVAVYLGMLPLASVLISFLVGVIILVSSSIGGKT